MKLRTLLENQDKANKVADLLYNDMTRKTLPDVVKRVFTGNWIMPVGANAIAGEKAFKALGYSAREIKIIRDVLTSVYGDAVKKFDGEEAFMDARKSDDNFTGWMLPLSSQVGSGRFHNKEVKNFIKGLVAKRMKGRF